MPDEMKPNNGEKKNEKETKKLTYYEQIVRWGLLVVAVCCVVAAFLHARYPQEVDQTTGIFLGMAAAILVLREVTRFETPWFKLEKIVHEEVKKAKDELETKAKVDAEQIKVDVKKTTEQLEADMKITTKQVGVIIQEGALTTAPRSQQAKSMMSRTATVSEDHTDDPNKGQFGERAEVPEQHRRLQATFNAIYGLDLLPYKITFWVESTDAQKHPLTGEVRFFLHPSFGSSAEYTVEVKGGKALDLITTWGSFTLGAVCIGSDGKECRLELDLAQLPGVSQKFKDS